LGERLALILANGDYGDLSVLRARLAGQAPQVVIAADGGARYAAALGTKLDVVIGDFDSTTPQEAAQLEQAGTELIRRPSDKNETDLELALLLAFERAAETAIVVGAAGGRIDMTVANVQLLLHPALAERRVSLWVGSQTAYLQRAPGGEVLGSPGDTVSLIPLGGPARGVTTHRLAFPLRGETLADGPARGVSNRIVEPGARIELTSGALLVVHTPHDSSPGA
jgi:thiamine pyrophosphokinase